MSTSAESPRGRGRSRVPLVLVIILGAPVTSNGQPTIIQPETKYEVVPVPEIRFDTSKFAPSPDDVREIRALIEQLTDIELPPKPYRTWMSSSTFPAIPLDRRRGPTPSEKPSGHVDPGERLVLLGPKAVAMLVESLDDATPTKIVVAGTVGQQQLAMQPPREKRPEHVVTRGDLCHAILGQIANRSWRRSAVLLVLNPAERFGLDVAVRSPSEDEQLVAQLRDEWSGRDPARALFDALMVDFHTRGQGSESIQSGAAVRLMYYFPEQSADLIASRLDSLDVGRIMPGSDREAWLGRYKTNGVRPQELVRAVTFVPNATVDRALVRLLERCDDPQIFQEAICASVVAAAPDTVYRRMREIVEVPPDATGPYGGGYLTLVKAVRYFPDRARPLVERHAAHGTVNSQLAAIGALRQSKRPVSWAADYLRPWLDDTTPTLYQYGPLYDRRAIRICDHAAQALIEHIPEAKFELEGTHDDLDGQIELLRRFVDGDTSVVFGTDKPLPLDPASVDAREPIAVIELPESLGQVFDISDRETIFVGHGFRGNCGWAYEIVWLSVEDGSVLIRTPMDEWRGGVSIVRPMHGDSFFCYHGYEGGHIIQREVRTGVMIRRLETPFHGHPRDGRLNMVRNLSDLAVSGDNSWILAFTPDGGLHSIDVATGRHTREWQLEGEPRTPMGYHGKIIPIQGSNQFLLKIMRGPGQEPLRLWDQDTRKMTELEKVPDFGWRSAWGPIAWNHLNSRANIWNLDERRRIDLPGIEGITDVISDGETALYARLADGTIVVIDLELVVVVGRLAPPAESEFTTMSLSRDRQLLFWVTREHQTDESAGSSKIAIFEVADLMR